MQGSGGTIYRKCQDVDALEGGGPGGSIDERKDPDLSFSCGIVETKLVPRTLVPGLTSTTSGALGVGMTSESPGAKRPCSAAMMLSILASKRREFSSIVDSIRTKAPSIFSSRPAQPQLLSTHDMRFEVENFLEIHRIDTA